MKNLGTKKELKGVVVHFEVYVEVYRRLATSKTASR